MHGTEEIQQRYLPAMIEGREENVAIALTEPGVGLRRRRTDNRGRERSTAAGS